MIRTIRLVMRAALAILLIASAHAQVAQTPPSPVLAVPPGSTHTVVVDQLLVPALTAPDVPWMAFTNAPPSFAYDTWEGTQLNVTIDGVVLVCTYATAGPLDGFSLNCTVAQPSAAP